MVAGADPVRHVPRHDLDTIRVVIQEIPRENWGVGGATLADSGQDESLPQ
ncbi:tautomerase family protein [Promicromonospora iranensis]|uniref:Phenylpyruvate tautomerase PptA (4-oxalocrotonate tautomerase family) n=1 Tax=Promicromonospora iranensis TaxID=1105144 RepID=A0ABU2CKF2_9MICO|nr:tautomerase family protein [Promicromonospora iranensis]MDR7381796.1 phenylpyruvate tautomerase PptA (4-oxalocrotonate tautomerase family) [Promicromonospora iranensis]